MNIEATNSRYYLYNILDNELIEIKSDLNTLTTIITLLHNKCKPKQKVWNEWSCTQESEDER